VGLKVSLPSLARSRASAEAIFSGLQMVCELVHNVWQLVVPDWWHVVNSSKFGAYKGALRENKKCLRINLFLSRHLEGFCIWPEVSRCC
jgi:hypothetical protein